MLIDKQRTAEIVIDENIPSLKEVKVGLNQIDRLVEVLFPEIDFQDITTATYSIVEILDSYGNAGGALINYLAHKAELIDFVTQRRSHKTHTLEEIIRMGYITIRVRVEDLMPQMRDVKVKEMLGKYQKLVCTFNIVDLDELINNLEGNNNHRY